MSMKIALAGNPNSGKTTMFNGLTGASQYVGNWPGVTVEKKEGKLKGNKEVIIMDLPGIYSLSPYTPEEVVSRTYLIAEKPDAIINIVDATNLERNLYLTTQLTELGIPVVIALNMMDIIRKNGESINVEALSKALGCPVVETSALKSDGIKETAERAIALAQSSKKQEYKHAFTANVETALAGIGDRVSDKVDAEQLRWFSIKLFERDEKVFEQLDLPADTKEQIEAITERVESDLDDDSESIITNDRYDYISDVMASCVKRKKAGALSVSDKIDRIVTNRWLALPIFAAVIFLVYFVSISTVGTFLTDWVNETLFEEIIMGNLEEWMIGIGAAEWLISFLVEGIIAGVGAVLGFLPQMLVLFFCLALLEDCGYMARIAFIMDRIFRRFGLSGKSFIPILIGTGCGVPGIMASRTIENEPDRKMTIITTTFIPCAAKLPIIALIAGALFPGSIWVGPSAYFIGVFAIITSGIILKKTKGFRGEPAPFVMELPAYHMPGIKGVLIHMWDRGKSFVKKAGTIIFLACAVIWFLQSFNWSMEFVDAGESMLADIGNVLRPLFIPLGFGDWRAAVATVSGLVAKENVVGTFGILYGVEVVTEEGVEIFRNVADSFSKLGAYSFLVFNLLCAPCFAAIGAIKREMGSWKWMFIAIGYQTAFAYAASLVVYQLGMLFTGNGFGVATGVAIAVVLMFLFLLFRPAKKNDLQAQARKKVAVS